MEHDSLVRRAVNHLTKNGYRDIKADHISWPGGSPGAIHWTGRSDGKIPDITALDNTGAGLIAEIETPLSLYEAETKEQIRLFAAFAMQHGKTFWLAVPAGSASIARAILKEFGIAEGHNVRIWTL